MSRTSSAAIAHDGAPEMEVPRYKVMGDFFVPGYGPVPHGKIIEWTEAPNIVMVPINEAAKRASAEWVAHLNDLALLTARFQEAAKRKRAEEEGLDPGAVRVAPEVYTVPTMADFRDPAKQRPTGVAIPKKRTLNFVEEDGSTTDVLGTSSYFDDVAGVRSFTG